MKHVAFVIPTLDRIGGAEQQVILLAAGMARRGFRISVLTLAGSGGAALRMLQSTGVDFRSLGMRKGLLDLRGWVRFQRWIKQNQPDIVHAHLAHASLLARWIRLAAPVRALVDTIHSPSTGRVLRRLGYRLSAAMPDVVTAVSRATGEPWLSSGMASDERLAVIPNGVEIERWKSDGHLRNTMRTRLRLSNEFLWLSVGRLDPVKDHSTLLRSFALLSPEARLAIVGEGQLKSHLHALVKELGLTDRVQLPGFQTNVLPWLCAADGFVLTSRWEGLPMALLEAGACRLPVVLTDIPGLREVFQELCDGRLALPGDVEALAAGMQTMMCLPEKDRHDLGASMHKSVREKFSLDMVLDQWENLYNHQLEHNPQPSRFGISAHSLRRTRQLK